MPTQRKEPAAQVHDQDTRNTRIYIKGGLAQTKEAILELGFEDIDAFAYVVRDPVGKHD